MNDMTIPCSVTADLNAKEAADLLADREYASSKRYIPECALEFVRHPGKLKTILNDEELAHDLALICSDIDGAIAEREGARTTVLRACDRIKTRLVDWATESESVELAALEMARQNPFEDN